MIEYVNVTKQFGPLTVLDGINLTIKDGEITYVIGSSGTGKSVLVKHAVGLLRPDAGRVFIDKIDTSNFNEQQWNQIRMRYALVFQHPTLFDSMSLVDNVALPIRKHQKVSKPAAKKSAMEYLERVGMATKADLMPSDVGPGERKRVSIARALTLSPDCAILDEPTTGLDVVASKNIDEMISELSKSLGKTVIVVSHDLRSIFGVADRIVFLYKGKIRLDGSPSAFRASDDPVVRQFVSGEASGPMET
ncbi:MAG TPA: ATP-binding cassette domain-containing protein [Myxococcota bacterium]|jgi:phospholipid/cholesterol/gamma-HCH transport system ATP-binding protein|nr:ATP-binding cassette domain-containing protein [Myxococcota bacterium]HON24777.1 ATP-binding cassette domain-containing protein [Myxococcota bacterium]HOS62106.1 ATP-binding cassette domain-containing protein [Myxococcota bacterium]HPC92392.1 ATP-binding cassette domain-containing protein [Myxococcota bacterium]HPL25480.1 ATP-binding cassette domain-containing protein [Myxococcota bacterium]